MKIQVSIGTVHVLRMATRLHARDGIAHCEAVHGVCGAGVVGCALRSRSRALWFLARMHFCEGVRGLPGSLVRCVLPLWAVVNLESIYMYEIHRTRSLQARAGAGHCA